MTQTTEWVALSAALIMGLSGSAHCFGMCGGLASAFGMRVRRADNSLPIATHAALYQAGRLTGYVALGMLCGAFGRIIQSLVDLARIGGLFRAMSGVLLLLVAVRLLSKWNGLAILERIGAHLWKAVRPFAGRLSGASAAQTLLLGLVWGLLPCGLVYSMLAFAALSGSALQGAELMAAFGLGTVPAMFFNTAIAANSAKIMSSPRTRRAGGVLLAAFAAWLIVSPLYIDSHSDHAGHQGHPHTSVDE